MLLLVFFKILFKKKKNRIKKFLKKGMILNFIDFFKFFIIYIVIVEVFDVFIIEIVDFILVFSCEDW